MLVCVYLEAYTLWIYANAALLSTCPAPLSLCSCRTSLFFFLLFSAVDHKLHSPCSLCFSQVRKFVSKDSAGLRVRSHPSLQSDQIGIVHVNGTIIFIDEVTDCRPARIIPIMSYKYSSCQILFYLLFL